MTLGSSFKKKKFSLSDFIGHFYQSSLFFKYLSNFSIIDFFGRMEKKKHQQTLRELSHDSALTSRYELIEIIGEGCFGKVIRAKSKRTGRLCALKLERHRKSRACNILKNEIEVLKTLQGQEGIPTLYSYGEWANGLYCQMQLLENDMNTAHKYTPNSITELTLELLKIMEGMHKKGIIHQDIKPHNIMKKDGKYFLIDFGLSRISSTQKSKNLYAIKGFIGTPRYASVRAHNMFEQGQKDDLESLFYNIAYFYYQRLPWSKLHVSNQTKLQKIKILKVRHRETLFQQMPSPFQLAFNYITGLPPLASPDYHFLTGFFKRTRTLVLSNLMNQRSAVKRTSLNMSNFLQVPDSIFELKQGKPEEQCGRSNPSIGLASDAVHSQYLQFEVDDKQNFCQGEDIEPALPNISKYFQNLVLRNPFDS